MSTTTITTLQQLLDACHDAMVEAIREECDIKGSEYAKDATCATDTNDGYIDIYMDWHGETQVLVYHNNDSHHECPLLAEAIENALPDWDETVEQYEEEHPDEDEWTSHGFRDEDDYLEYRYG